MQLAQTETIRIFDDHHRRVRDVDPDLDHGRGHQHVELTASDGGHDRLLRRGVHPSVHQPDSKLREHLGADPLELGFRRLHLQRGRVLHQRADDEGLPSPRNLGADHPIRPGA